MTKKVNEQRMKLRIEYSRETNLIFSDHIPAYADWLEKKLALSQPPVSGNEVALPSLEQCANACNAYAEAKEERKREYGLVYKAYQEGINWALNFVNKARQ